MTTIRAGPPRPSRRRFESQGHVVAAAQPRLPAGARGRAAAKEDRSVDEAGASEAAAIRVSRRIAGTVYGTIVVMATVTAGSEGEQTDAWRLAVVVAVTVMVLWVAHVYAHALAESLEQRPAARPGGARLGRAP